MKKILVIHGPNLNLLGAREPGLYGTESLSELNDRLHDYAFQSQLKLVAFQSNSEAEIIDVIQNTLKNHIDYLIINPAAFTHTSIAIRDALLAVQIPFIEVHITNVFLREEFRHHSYFSDIAQGTICGLGTNGYFLAVQAVISLFNKRES